MGRPLEVPGAPLDKTMKIRVSEKMLERLDALRGKRSRSRYIRDLIRDEAARKAGT
jgi:metal-responsive CopG/Arc/MetJ family transcriptional regulator